MPVSAPSINCPRRAVRPQADPVAAFCCKTLSTPTRRVTDGPGPCHPRRFLTARITDITSNKKLTASIGCPVRAATGLKVDREIWAAGNVMKGKEQLSGGCTKRNSRLTDRCDLVCPDLSKVGPLTLIPLRGLVFALIDPGLARGGARTREGLFLRHEAWIRPILRHFSRALVAR